MDDILKFFSDKKAEVCMPLSALMEFAESQRHPGDDGKDPNPGPDPDPTPDPDHISHNFGTATYPDFKVYDGQDGNTQGKGWIDSFRKYGVRSLSAGNEDKVIKKVVDSFTHEQTVDSLILRAGYRNNELVGGMISLEDIMSMRRGRLEVRFRINSAPEGYHFAIWTLQNDGAWPPEFDFLEFVNSTTNPGSNGKFHFNDHARQGSPDFPVQNITIVDAQSIWGEWNTVALEVTDQGTKWYLNDKVVREAGAKFHKPHHFLASWEGGSKWPGPVTDRNAVAEIEFDYLDIDKVS